MMKLYLHRVLTVAVLSVVLFLSDMIFHGVLLKDAYLDTSSLWRAEDEMNEYLLFTLFTYFVASISIVVLFEQFVVTLGNKQLLVNSFKISLLVGIIVGVILIRFYTYMPIGFGLALAWFCDAIIHAILVAVFMYFLYRNKF